MIIFLKTSNKDAESSGKTSSVAIDSSKAAIRVEVIEKTDSTYLILTATTEETAEYPKYEGVTYTKTVDVWLSKNDLCHIANEAIKAGLVSVQVTGATIV